MTAEEFDALSWAEKEAELMRAASEASAEKHKDWQPTQKQDSDKTNLFQQEEEERTAKAAATTRIERILYRYDATE